ncbi:MAG: hypothetical protein ABSF37_04065 [Sedimentisphaerales bacterium]|jgi:hypothetical protein
MPKWPKHTDSFDYCSEQVTLLFDNKNTSWPFVNFWRKPSLPGVVKVVKMIVFGQVLSVESKTIKRRKPDESSKCIYY